MKSFRKKLRSFTLKHYNQFERWRWLIVLVIGLGLFSAEVYEFYELSFLNQPLHLFEVFLYAALLISTGLFLELFVRLNRLHKRMVKILEYKHNLSVELTFTDDWDSLIAKLAQLPGMIVNADEAYLLVNNLISNKFEAISHWADDQQEQPAEIWDVYRSCQNCFEGTPENNARIHLCRNDNETSSFNAYSLSITDENFPTILLKFRLKPGLQLSADEEKIFINISDEIAVAFRAARDHRRLSELQSAETAMAERRLVSAYVHDQLGQNLGYLHLKLDQLAANKAMINTKGFQKDLKQLSEVANDSYEIVRDILKKMQPGSIPHLTNLLKEHAIRVSRKANFTLEFKDTGKPIPLSSDVQHAVFYAFHEILSNVEKHSKASTVNVVVNWNDSFLDISVADNGIGFNPGMVNKDEHFGLGILQERIAGLGGKLLLNSSTDSGTIISISLPVKLPEKELHGQQE